jgi:hypothetical protein
MQVVQAMTKAHRQPEKGCQWGFEEAEYGEVGFQNSGGVMLHIKDVGNVFLIIILLQR